MLLTNSMKTPNAKYDQTDHKWWIIDANGLVLGRLAAVVATYLRGKHKSIFTPHIDCGDSIVIINADKVQVTGNKYLQHKFYWHTGWPGGIKEQSIKDRMTGPYPERVIMKAVERMLPKGVMGRQQLKKLRIYKGDQHPHEAQQPLVLDVKDKNPKNARVA